ncbi:MAG: hypothetical protein ACLTDR_13670 [Adlercreutzia equolifaciens]
MLADLDTSPQELTVGEETATIASGHPDILAEASGIAPFAAAFPGQAEKHYALNPYMRLETFDVDMPRKQEAYGFPSDLVGSYGFGAFFGTSQHWVNGVSQGTNFNDYVLNTTSSSFDAVVDAFLYETIAARNGADAPFATSAHRQRLPRSLPHHGQRLQGHQLQRGKRTHQPRHGPSHLRHRRRFQRLRRRGKQPQRRQLHHLQGHLHRLAIRVLTGGTSSTTKSMPDLPPPTRSSRTLSATCSWSPSTPGAPRS